MTQCRFDNFPKAKLTLEIQDLATSDDPLEIFLQRRGWKLERVAGLQKSISEKLTVDMFSGETQALSTSEVKLQSDIQKFLVRR